MLIKFLEIYPRKIFSQICKAVCKRKSSCLGSHIRHRKLLKCVQLLKHLPETALGEIINKPTFERMPTRLLMGDGKDQNLGNVYIYFK